MMHTRIRSYKRLQHMVLLPVLLITSTMYLIACTSGIGNPGVSRGDAGNTASRVLACKSTDRQIASQDQCLLDDAACYQISSGQWCTGPRGNVCPAGSVALSAGEACPAGSRCIRVGESLECRI